MLGNIYLGNITYWVQDSNYLILSVLREREYLFFLPLTTSIIESYIIVSLQEPLCICCGEDCLVHYSGWSGSLHEARVQQVCLGSEMPNYKVSY